MKSWWDRLIIQLVIFLLVWTTWRLLIRINISLSLLIVAIMHYRLHRHPIGLLGIWGTKRSSLLDRGYLLISNWMVFSGWIRWRTAGLWWSGLYSLCSLAKDKE